MNETQPGSPAFPDQPLPAAKDKLLFTPGPLNTSSNVRQAMLHDVGSWHFEFNAIVASVRERLLQLAGVSRAGGWEVVLLQGSGTFGVEAVFQTCVPPNGKVAVFANGAYGERIVQMLQHARINHAVLRTAEDQPADPVALDKLLSSDKAITHVAVVHCETTTGILNPIEAISSVSRKHGKIYIVDAMSSFGAYPIDFEVLGIDFLISSANKCVEGVPGFSFVFCRRKVLTACEGYARSLSLDLLGQLKGFEKNGQFRYTPPTHVVLAFNQALTEMEQEGGVAARGARYRRNNEVLLSGMSELGFKLFLDPSVQSYIITGFHTPTDPKFTFDVFYRKLSDRGYIVYPGKLTQVDTFRIGNIGRLFTSDIEQLLHAIRKTLQDMGCAVPVSYK
jgi:2-aminoethylphosphonate-pyruvate transaminase